MTGNSANDNFPSGRISDRYRINREIGKGGMGFVYLAEDLQLMRWVAIKTIRPELVEREDVRKRIERECMMHAAIRVHPHIIALYDRVDEGKNIFLILEYVDGKNLSELISSARLEGKKIPVDFIVNIACQLLDALATIHEHDIIHRDIKPSNVIVGELDSSKPYAKLMDFGIAREAVEEEDLTRLTMVDAGGPGTPAYMAPERFDPKTYGEICPATDLYAVGIIIYELLCLEPPYHGAMTEVISGHLTSNPDFSKIASFPDSLQHVLSRALAKKVEDRFQTALQFVSALQKISGDYDEKTLLVTPSSHEIAHNETMLDASFPLGNSTDTITPQTRVLPGSRIFLLLLVLALVVGGIYFYSSTNLADNTAPQPDGIQQQMADDTPIASTEKIVPPVPAATDTVASSKTLNDPAEEKIRQPAPASAVGRRPVEKEKKEKKLTAQEAYEIEIAKKEKLRQIRKDEQKALAQQKNEQLRKEQAKKKLTPLPAPELKVAPQNKYISIPTR